MRRTGVKRSSSVLLGLALLVAAWLGAARPAGASAIVLKDGRRLEGNIAQITGLADNPLGPKNDAALITLVDDNLRRIFIPTYRVLKIDEADRGEVKEKIQIQQPKVRREGRSRLSHVGQVSNVKPFDKFGRRTVRMITEKGPLDIVQGITELTPLYAKVEAMASEGRPSVVWEMRIATSSIPRETLHDILANYIDPKKLEQRLRVARLLLQAERYLDARKELEAIIADFPGEKQLATEVQALRQLYARSILKEIEVRRKAGQHALAWSMLQQFPANEVAGEILRQVRDMLDEYSATQKKFMQLQSDLDGHVAAIKDTPTRQQCEAILAEMKQELSINTLDRLAAYSQLQDTGFNPEQNVALAISGWLLGSDHSDPNLSVALALAKTRDLVQRYLNEPVKLERNQLFERIRSQEGSSAAQIAQLVAHMKPPLDTPLPSPAEPGFYSQRIPAGVDKEPDVNYFAQLPDEYDPHVRYPTIVTLAGETTTPQRQIDWWAGPMNEKGGRLGHASRSGYIVIAVDWMKEGQSEYEYSAREHAAVLGSLRDACRRFSINTDRVFLTGHSIGGDAAWDIGLAHPDLWAGVIPIVAESDKYCRLYWENARQVPFYVLAGELDGEKTVKNARDLDRYLTHKFDVTVVEYRGRGHEDFYEDIRNLFDWMDRRDDRNFFPKEFAVSTMRTWDNFFWWFEAGKLPARTIVEPNTWPPAHGATTAKIAARVLPSNGLSVTTGASQVTVWLSPETVDFTREMKVVVNGKTITKRGLVPPDLRVLLEDVRTRADRLHPFWAKVEQ